MYYLKNLVEDIVIAELKSDAELINKVKEIAIENEDFDFSIIGVSDALQYVEEYCDNLEILENTPSFTVSLSFECVVAKNPLEATKIVLGWIKKGAEDMIFDVEDELSKEKFSVDMSEDEEDAVQPNND